MPETILYFAPVFVRPLVPMALVKYFNLDIKCVDISTDVETFNKNFPMKLIPTLYNPNGLLLTEELAINNYIIKSSGNEEEIEKLLGCSNLRTESEILRWESLAVSDFMEYEASLIKPLIGMKPYAPKSVSLAEDKLKVVFKIYEDKLKTNKYLVNENITLADLTTAACFSFGFEYLYDKEWRLKYPNITRWYQDVTVSPYLKGIFAGRKFIDKAIERPKA